MIKRLKSLKQVLSDNGNMTIDRLMKDSFGSEIEVYRDDWFALEIDYKLEDSLFEI